jgi:hypothetical protein
MHLSFRTFLLDRDDGLYRLSNTIFDRMLRNPTSHVLPRFAGQRLRMADVAVELMDRKPIRVVRTAFSILTFDDEGFLDSTAFEHHQRARAELALAPALGPRARHANVVPATQRFVDQRGRWAPSVVVARLIERAALERMKWPRL